MILNINEQLNKIAISQMQILNDTDIKYLIHNYNRVGEISHD